jgi:predicted ATPase
MQSKMTFPAVQLFVGCLSANGIAAYLSDSDALAVSGICRRLEGIALALELVAGRVDAFVIQGIATLLDRLPAGLQSGRRR